MNTLRDAHEVLDGLNEAELVAVNAVLQLIKQNRESNNPTINTCADSLRGVDSVDRLAIMTALAELVTRETVKTTEDPLHWFERPLKYHNLLVKHADGIFSTYDKKRRSALRATGEFVTSDDFAEIAESFELAGYNGDLVAEFLFQWEAANQPDSMAAKYVEEYALPSGKLSTKRGYHSREPLYYPVCFVFHRSIVEDYVRQECLEGDTSRAVINPILSLLATDDWEFAVSQLSKVQRRKLR